MTDCATLRCQLAEMRDRLVARLAKQVEGGDVALVAAVHGAIAAIDAAAQCPAEGADLMARAVVTAVPDGQVTMTLYAAADGRPAAVELSPLRAISLAGELIAAASRQLRS